MHPLQAASLILGYASKPRAQEGKIPCPDKQSQAGVYRLHCRYYASLGEVEIEAEQASASNRPKQLDLSGRVTQTLNMSLESLTPSQYQQAFEAYGEEHGLHARSQAVPRLSHAIARSPSASQKLLDAATQEAEELCGATASGAHLIEAALDEGVAIAVVNFPEEALEQLDREATESAGVKISRLSPVDPSHNGGMLRARTEQGAIKIGFNEDELSYYRSWSEEEMDELGIELSFDPIEAPDIEPEEQ